ncbi:hypothetical protein PR048_011813 [Dryococelus australis]|uniref:Uncharacterized protein n=1 Tax=Dryococelus australis TaxID=614101 RepID=A0ABQ9HMK5_9NEOP|nr:hypothetical protein PR048_011813 [Dryococelus australis]
MPRKKPRKTQQVQTRGLNTTDVLAKAVRTAVSLHGIPRRTLRHYINVTSGTAIITENGEGRGGKTALPHEYENQLANCLRILGKWRFGLSRNKILTLVQVFDVKSNELQIRITDGRPGLSWFINFRQMHNLSIEKPQGIEYVRMSQANPFTVFGFFDCLEKIIEENRFKEKPHLLFNCDKTSFAHDPSKTKTFGVKGEQSTRTISSTGHRSTTVLVTVSAAGDKLPILSIFKGKI